MNTSVIERRWYDRLNLHTVHSFVQAHLVWVLMGTYLLAGVAPRFGLALRSASVGTLRTPYGELALTAPTVLLALLVFNASLGVDTRQLRVVSKRPWLLLAGLLANSAIPLGFTMLCASVLPLWHNSEEMQSLLVGLAIVGSMPIAGSSTAWSQHASGNLALSLGLVLMSTLVSPVITPIGFHAVSQVTTGDYSDDLHALAGMGTQLFLLAGVVVPSCLGLVTRLLWREQVQRILPQVKAATLAALLLLNYANAAVALPRVIATPDWDFLTLTFVVVAMLCGLAFSGGWWVGRMVGAGSQERVSLMYALGMNNNGSGLVLASAQLAHHPNILLAIVAYNLVQQLAAGAADTWLLRQLPPDNAEAAS